LDTKLEKLQRLHTLFFVVVVVAAPPPLPALLLIAGPTEGMTKPSFIARLLCPEKIVGPL
jgi:hypothetical protein